MTTAGTHQRVGIIGLGDMGGAIASTVVREGFPLTVFDLREEAIAPLAAQGAIRAESIDELTAAVDLVSVVVVTDEQVRRVVDEVVRAAKPGTVILVHSTIQPQTIVDVAEVARRHDLDLIDAPVSGGPERARRGLLSVMIGGSDAAVAKCRALLDAIGGEVLHVGPAGAGAAVKLVNNLLTLGYYSLQVEAMRIGAAYGLDEDTIATVVIASGADSRGMRTWGRMDRIRQERIAAGWTDLYDRMAKDLRAAVVAGGAKSLILPMTSVAAQVLPSQLEERDQLLAGRPPIDVPRCSMCDQELAKPFRDAGQHPECPTRRAGG